MWVPHASHEEWRLAMRDMARIVECKLNQGQQRAPRARMLGAMRPEDVLNHAIDPLSPSDWG